MYRKDTLSNGIRVVSETMPKSRSMSIGVWVKVGSRHEAPQIGGVSHFIEHLFFKGTEKRTAKDIAIEIDALGGEMNAFTSQETTTYYVKVLDEHLPTAIDILADIVITVAGNFDHDPMIEMLNKSFGKLARTGIPKQEVTPAFTRAVAVKKKQLEQVQICLGCKGIPFVHEDRFVM